MVYLWSPWKQSIQKVYTGIFLLKNNGLSLGVEVEKNKVKL